MTDSDAPDDPLLGAAVETSIGTIVVERVLGRGGFATVYAGQGVDRPVAIKILHAEHIGSKAVMRFAREVAIVRRLRHPNIAEVLSAGTLPDGRPYCTMELLRGRELGVALKDGPLAPADIVEIVGYVADALGAAHAVRVVHRDVKSRNVFLCEDGRVMLLDFGVAKLAIASGLTMSREAVGTLGSMAPEQLAGRPVDARADIYALGALAFHLVTGRPPLTGENAIAIGFAHLSEVPPRAKTLRPDLPDAWDDAIATALEKAPADRLASAGAFRDKIATK